MSIVHIKDIIIKNIWGIWEAGPKMEPQALLRMPLVSSWNLGLLILLKVPSHCGMFS